MEIGYKVPEKLGVDQDGKEVLLSDFSGKKLILYFYPKDNTSGCTAEACSLRDGYAALRERGFEIVGVSKDTAKSHLGFIAKHQLPFRLIVDEGMKLAETFGIVKEKSLYGKKYMGVERTTFVISPEGVILYVLRGKAVKTASHAEQLLQLDDQGLLS